MQTNTVSFLSKSEKLFYRRKINRVSSERQQKISEFDSRNCVANLIATYFRILYYLGISPIQFVIVDGDQNPRYVKHKSRIQQIICSSLQVLSLLDSFGSIRAQLENSQVFKRPSLYFYLLRSILNVFFKVTFINIVWRKHEHIKDSLNTILDIKGLRLQECFVGKSTNHKIGYGFLIVKAIICLIVGYGIVIPSSSWSISWYARRLAAVSRYIYGLGNLYKPDEAPSLDTLSTMDFIIVPIFLAGRFTRLCMSDFCDVLIIVFTLALWLTGKSMSSRISSSVSAEKKVPTNVESEARMDRTPKRRTKRRRIRTNLLAALPLRRRTPTHVVKVKAGATANVTEVRTPRHCLPMNPSQTEPIVQRPPELYSTDPRCNTEVFTISLDTEEVCASSNNDYVTWKDVYECVQNLKSLSSLFSTTMGAYVLWYIYDSALYYSLNLNTFFTTQDYFEKAFSFVAFLMVFNIIYWSTDIANQVESAKEFYYKKASEGQRIPKHEADFVLFEMSNAIGIRAGNMLLLNYAFIGSLLNSVLTFFVMFTEDKAED